MTWAERISVDAAVVGGKPVIQGTRLSVDFVLGLLAAGWTVQDVLENYPHITIDDVRACFAYASEHLGTEKVYPLRS